MSCAAPRMPDKGVLDLMGQHGGKAADRASRAAMGELIVDLLCHGPWLDLQQDVAGLFGHIGGLDVDKPLAAAARCTDQHFVFVGTCLIFANGPDQVKYGTGGRNDIGYRERLHGLDAGMEKTAHLPC